MFPLPGRSAGLAPAPLPPQISLVRWFDRGRTNEKRREPRGRTASLEKVSESKPNRAGGRSTESNARWCSSHLDAIERNRGK